MNYENKILDYMKKNSDTITIEEVKELNIPSVIMTRLIGKNLVERVKPGLYVLKKGLWRDMLIHIPIIGRLYIALEIWMLFKTLHIGLEARLNFINTLTLAMDAIKCPMLKRDLQVIHDKLLAGYSISDSFSGMQYVPTSMIIALSVGEKGNNLKDSLKHISDSLYSDLCRQVKVLGRVLGHGMILCTGLIFLFIIYSLFQPLYDYIGVVTF